MADIKYGHTDSLFIGVESIKQAQKICKILNKEVQELFPNVFNLKEHPVSLEFEKFYRTLGVGSTKNRNAGMISWKDGKYLDEEEFVMTGFVAKRISETPLAKDVQLTVLKMWVNEEGEEKIVNYLRNKFNQVLSGGIPVTDLAKRTRYREERFQVYCSNCKKHGWKYRYNLQELGNIQCCNNPNYRTWQDKKPTIGSGIEGVLFYNMINPNDLITDSYLFLRITNCNQTYTHPITKEIRVPNYISVKKIEEFDGYTPDYFHYAYSVVSKAEPIFNAMGWDINKISKDKKQGELEEWF